MSRRGLLAVVILLGLIGLVAYDRWSGRRRQERETERARVFHIDADRVDAVRLHRPEGEVLLRRAAGGWALQQPVTAPADLTTADDLVGSLLRATIEKRLGPIEDLSGFGLTGEATGIEITAADGGGSERVRIGGEHPFNGHFYAQIGDDPEVVLVSSDAGRARTVEVFELRDRALIALQNWKMRTLEIQGPDRTFSLVRDQGRWDLAAPVRTPADDGTVADLISHLGRLEAIAFAADDPDDLGPFGLDAPRIRLTLMQEDWTEPHRIDFGSDSPDGNLYARRWDRAAVMEVEQAIWPKLNLSLDTLRSGEILQLSRWTVSGIDADDPGGPLRLAKDDTDAWRDETAGRPADRNRVEELLDALEDLEAERYIDDPGDDLSGYGLDAPRMRLALRTTAAGETPDAAATAPFQILVGDEKEGYCYVRAGDWPTVFQVPAGAIGQVEAGLAALRAAAVMEPVEGEDVAVEAEPPPAEAGPEE